MPVYVTPLYDVPRWTMSWPWREACRMLADTDAELHSMAATIGLMRKWHQHEPISHYNLTSKNREAALLYNAVEVDRKFWLDRIKESK